MNFFGLLGFILLVHLSNGAIRVKRGGHTGTHVLISPGLGGYGGLGKPAHVLNVGSYPAFHSHSGPQDAWYANAAVNAGDPYAAKTIAEGQFTVQQADADALNAAYGIIASANDKSIANEVAYASKNAENALYNAASIGGAAAVYTGTARQH